MIGPLQPRFERSKLLVPADLDGSGFWQRFGIPLGIIPKSRADPLFWKYAILVANRLSVSIDADSQSYLYMLSGVRAINYIYPATAAAVSFTFFPNPVPVRHLLSGLNGLQ